MALNKIKLPDNSVVEINDCRINLSSVSDGQVLKYSSSTQKFENANEKTELPSQTGNSGKFLTTDGSDASWANLPSDVFWCNFTLTENNGNITVTCDKTVSEIATAYNSGKSVIGKIGYAAIPLNMVQGSGTYYIAFILMSGASYMVIQGTNSTNPDTWIYEDEDLKISDLYDVRITSAANNDVLKYDSAAGGWVNGQVPGGGLTDYDFTHTQILGTLNSVTFAAGERCSVFAYVNIDTSMSIACENNSDNYIWICNSGSSDVDITISDITQNSISVSNVYIPEDGITVPAGKVCEIGVIVNSSGAFITCRNDIVLSSSI